MEYVEGRDLASLAETGLLPFPIVNFIISEVLCGLGYAHELPAAGPVRGLVHRDVSPQNVLLSWEGAVKVSDFGIAKAREASAATASLLIKGKVAYMSPEQANGEALDGRSDLFAVGIMLWELLTGRMLFDGTAREALAQVMFGPIPRPSSVRPGIPSDLEAVAMRLLERDRSARYANAGLAIDDLASCADAPRGGGRELARLLAARFPDAVAARSARPHVEGGTPPASASPSPSPQDRVTVRDDRPARGREPRPDAHQAPGKSSEAALGNAVSQSAGRSRHGARWPRIAVGGLVLVVAATGTMALAVATRDGRPSGEPAGGSSLAPDGPGSAIKAASPPVDPPSSAGQTPAPPPAPPIDAGIAIAAPDATPAAASTPKAPAPPPGRPPKPARSESSRPSSSDEPDDILETRN
jgi:eukaryotic-like serine/threonine-protein kinase